MITVSLHLSKLVVGAGGSDFTGCICTLICVYIYIYIYILCIHVHLFTFGLLIAGPVAAAPIGLPHTVGAKDCTPEIDTSEIIVDFQRHFPMDGQW